MPSTMELSSCRPEKTGVRAGIANRTSPTLGVVVFNDYAGLESVRPNEKTARSGTGRAAVEALTR